MQLRSVSHRHPRGWLLALQAGLALSLFGTAALGAQAPAADSVRIERLASLGRLWVSIRYFHPWLAYRPIDWDAALVAADLRVSAATDRAAYAAAIQEMLGALGDPVTKVQPERGPNFQRGQQSHLSSLGQSTASLLLRGVSLHDWRNVDH
jgi:hypothetical protein